MSHIDWLSYAYGWNPLVGEFDKITITTPKTPTNPPEVIFHRDIIQALPVFCEDGWYALPERRLSDNLVSHRQHRKLYGFIDPEN
jgi:hypothetical protein